MLKNIIIKSMLFVLITTAVFATTKELNIYTSRHYSVDNEIIKEFEKKTKIKVNVLQGNSASLIQKLESEKKNTPADLLITADAISIYRAKRLGLLQSIDSKFLDSNIPVKLRDNLKQIYPVTKRARVIIYNVDKVNPSSLSTYENLADPSWKGQILVRSSNNAYDQSLLAFIISTTSEKEATAWARGMVNNFARTPKGNDRDQLRAVSSGVGKLTIANTYYLGLMSNSTDTTEKNFTKNLKIFFPNQETTGTHINISAAGVTAHAKNKENAILFMEFILSEKIQKKYMDANFEYPVNSKVKWNKTLQGFGKFKENTSALNTLDAYQEEAIKIFDLAKWR